MPIHQQHEALLQIGQSRAVCLGLVLLRIHRVDDHQFLRLVHHDVHPHPVLAVYHVVHGHVLDERQECQHRNGEVHAVGWHVDVDVELACIPHFHHLAERPRKFQFFLQRHQLFALALQDVAEDVAQVVDIADGELVILLADETADAAKRVEKEVRIDLVRQCGATTLQTLNPELLQLLLLLLMDNAQVVGEAQEQSHHAHDDELERQDDGASVEACADECRDALVEAVCHDGQCHVRQDALQQRLRLQPAHIEQQQSHRERPEEQETDEHVVDVADTPIGWHAVPVPTQKQEVGIADECRAHQTGQQNLIEGFIVFHSW